jgi:hypothetical protein
MTSIFDGLWKDIQYTDKELRELQNELIKDPKKGKVIKGTGGFRKIRYQLPSKGKSGGIRIIYLDIESSEIIYLLMVYMKNEKDNLTKEECRKLKSISVEIKNQYGK